MIRLQGVCSFSELQPCFNRPTGKKKQLSLKLRSPCISTQITFDGVAALELLTKFSIEEINSSNDSATKIIAKKITPIFFGGRGMTSLTREQVLPNHHSKPCVVYALGGAGGLINTH